MLGSTDGAVSILCPIQSTSHARLIALQNVMTNLLGKNGKFEVGMPLGVTTITHRFYFLLVFLFFVYSFFSLFFLFTFVHLWWLVVVCSSSVRYESDCVPCKYVPSIEWVENECQGCSDDFVSCHRRQFHFEIFKFKQQRAGRFVEIHWYQSQYYY